jgi:hypothetical protein
LIEAALNLAWFDNFFGAAPGASFFVEPALLNGGCCYGPNIRIGGREEMHCMLGVWKTNGKGDPVFDKSMLPTVVHEFCHSYANPLVDANLDGLRASGSQMFRTVKSQMERQAYGNWATMMRESLVRASVIRYLAENEGVAASRQQAVRDARNGFAWVPDLADLLGAYGENRETYPTLEGFMPEVVRFFEEYAENVAAAE